jgi:hypothetical protein
VAQANTARQALEILTGAKAGAVVEETGRRLLAGLREYAGSGPRLEAVILDFSGSPLWWGVSLGRSRP